MEDTHVAALVEDLRGHFKAFGDSLQATNDNVSALGVKVGALGVKVDALDVKVDGIARDLFDVKERLTRVEHAVNGKPRKRKPGA